MYCCFYSLILFIFEPKKGTSYSSLPFGRYLVVFCISSVEEDGIDPPHCFRTPILNERLGFESKDKVSTQVPKNLATFVKKKKKKEETK